MNKQIIAFMAGYSLMAGAGNGTAFLQNGMVEAGWADAAANAPTDPEATLLGKGFVKNVRHFVSDVYSTDMAAFYVNGAEDERAPLLAMVSAPNGSDRVECDRESCLDVSSLWHEHSDAVGLASAAIAQVADSAGGQYGSWPHDYGNFNGITSGGTQVLGSDSAGTPDNLGGNGGSGGAPNNLAGNSGTGGAPDNLAGKGGTGGAPDNLAGSGGTGGAPDNSADKGGTGDAPGKGAGATPGDRPYYNGSPNNPPGKTPPTENVGGGRAPVMGTGTGPNTGTASDFLTVPEPGSLALLVLGMAGLAWVRGRRKGQA